MLQLNPSLENYYAAAQGLLFENPVDTAMTALPKTAEHMLFYKVLNYLPLAVGISLGRLLQLSLMPCIYLGRILEGALYAWLTYHAIQGTPIGKPVFALIGLMPMALMNLTGYGYDGIVLVVLLNVTTSVLKMASGDSSRTREKAEALLWAFLLGAVKGGGYLLALPLYFILVVSAPRGSWKKKMCGGLALTSLGSVLVFDYLLQDHTQRFFQLGTEGGEKLTAAFAYQHPLQYVKLWVTSMVSNVDAYFFTAFGSHLAWYESIVPHLVIAALLVALCAAALWEKNEYDLCRKSRGVLFAAAFCIFFFTPVMLLKDTKVSSLVIGGIQGRYFLPAFVFVLLAVLNQIQMNSKTLLQVPAAPDARRQIQSKCYLAFCVVSCIAVYYMMRTYLTR